MELTQEYFDQMVAKLATKDDLTEELKPLKDNVAEIKTKLAHVIIRTKEDDEALASDYLEIRRKMAKIEKRLGLVETSHAA